MTDLIIIIYLLLIIGIISFMVARKKKKFVLGLIPKRFRKRIHDFGHTFTISAELKNLPKLILSTTLIWLIEFSVFYFIFKALNLSYPFYLVIFVTLLVAVLTAIPLTPAGLGAVEAGAAGFLILYGIDKNYAITFIFLERLITYWSILVGGAITYIASKQK
jgi:uncharacterized protein (TIRG00374 family)